MLDPAQFPEAAQWGSINLGGPMTTAAGLVFIAATRDDQLRAFDIETGACCGRRRCPPAPRPTPMTYEVGGRQYVVIAAGGHGKLGSKLGDYVLAFAVRR